MTNKDEFRKNIGLRVQQQRKQRGYTQLELAKMLKIPKSTLGMWESGRNAMPVDAIVAVAKILSVDFDYFVGLDGSKILSIDGNAQVMYRGRTVPSKYLNAIKLMMDDDIKNKNI